MVSTLGLVSVGLIPFFFGSSYVPMKMYDSGDGMFAQWMMCVGLMVPGFISSFMAGSSQVYYMVMLGGGLYAAANTISIYIMEGIGMVLGSLLWNVSICLVSWAMARFGIVGNAELPTNNWLNILAIITLVFGGLLFAMVQNSPIRSRPHPLLEEKDEEELAVPSEVTLSVGQKQKRMFCIFLAAAVGVLYANMLTPVKYIKDHGGLQDPMVYMMSFSLGAMFTSTFMFVIYAFFMKKNLPVMNPNLAVPAFSSGVIYGVGVVLLAIANTEVSQIIAFPIAAMSPGLVNAVWAIVLFKEIQGRRNLQMLASAFVVSSLGIVMLALSKL